MQPNIILINCDDLGYGDLGCYGSTKNKTPILDKMADEGMRFTDYYVASPVCSPSRGALMTGCYPPRIGFGSFEGKWVLFPGQGVGLNPEEITIASILKDAGYSTKIIGKWHCGDQKEFLPTRHGFDSYYGIPYSNDMGRQINRTMYPPLPLMRDEDVIQEQPDQTSVTERYMEESVRYIRDNKDNPFFLYLAHMYVHLPHYPPQSYLADSQNGAYGACVAAIDWSVGVILDELKRQGLSENTLVIFTSDNGSRNDMGESNGPLRGTKGTTWDGGQRVPLIMHWPGVISQSVCSELSASMDLYPTLAALSGAKVPTDRIIDGLDMSNLILGKSAKSPRDTFFYYRLNTIEAVRHGDWKLHLRKKDEAINELYNLRDDIGETINLYDENPKIVVELNAIIEKCRHDMGDEAKGIKGENNRPIGEVENPDTLTHYDPDHPYIISEYDLEDAG